MKRLIFFGLCFLPFLTNAQRHHEIGIWAGVANYYGDLQTNWVPTDIGSTKTYRPGGGIIYKYFLNPRVGVRFGASYVTITGADSLSQVTASRQRNLSFQNNMFEGYGALELNFIPVEVNRFKVSPYLFAGVGAVYSRPFTRDNDNKKVFLRDLSTEGQGLPNYPDRKVYPLFNPMIPVGGGIKFFVGKTLMVTAEVGLRYVASDYLDDVSRSYVNMDTLLAYKGQKSVELSYRGNEKVNWDGNYPNYKFARGDFKKNDWYWTAGITTTIYFDAFPNVGKYLQTQCPAIFGRSW